MGNTEILRRGDVQLTSAGTGISHSEKAHGPKQVHFLQIWSLPSTSKLQPKYFTRHFSDEEKTDKWVRVVAPVGADGVLPVREGKGPAPVQSPLTLYTTILGQNKSLNRSFTGKKGYVHVVQTSGYNEGQSQGASIKIASDGEKLTLGEGDGAYILVENGVNSLEVENVGDRVAEVLVFDLDWLFNILWLAPLNLYTKELYNGNINVLLESVPIENAIVWDTANKDRMWSAVTGLTVESAKIGQGGGVERRIWKQQQLCFITAAFDVVE
jgi:Pirin